jgi:hypothetical protein
MQNTDGRAEILWRLRARHSTAQCVLEQLPVGVLLTLLQDDDVVLHETFPDAHLAKARASALRERLEAKGWQAVPSVGPEPGRRRPGTS